MKRRTSKAAVVLFLLLSLHGVVCAQSFASSSASSSGVANGSWRRSEPIEEITPESLAWVASMRRQRQQAATNPRTIASAAAIPNLTAQVPLPASGLEVPRVTLAENELLARLSPIALEWNGNPEAGMPDAPALQTARAPEYENYLVQGRPTTRFPYSPADKFRLFIKDTYDPFALMGEGFTAFYNQAQGSPRAFGGGPAGYSRRLGAIVGTDFAGEFFGTFLFPSILHTDPRYFRKGEGSFGSRALYAMTRILITKKDSGGNTFNASNFLSGFATTAISNTYYPGRDRSVGATLERATINIGFDSLTALYREFWPEMAHALHIPAFVIRRTADPMFPVQGAAPTPAQHN